MRDYKRFDEYLNQLYGDIYHQSEDEGHKAFAKDVIDTMLPRCNAVLDVGAGTGFCQDYFEALKVKYTGITLGKEDIQIAKNESRKVFSGDMTFLNYGDNSFDLIFARHVLEHSPFPIITLMEWHRVASEFLLLVSPSVEYWGYMGKNHYSVASKEQLWWWLKRSGWMIIDEQDFRMSDRLFEAHYSDNQKRMETGKDLVTVPGYPKIVEYRYLCRKVEPQIE